MNIMPYSAPTTSDPIQKNCAVGPSSRVVRSVIGLKGTLGFMVGTFLFIYGPVINSAFSGVLDAQGQNARLPLNWDPLQWTGALFAISYVFDFMFEVPTGLLADMFGRKFVIVLSLVFRFLSFLSMFILVSLPARWGFTPLIVAGVVYWFFYVVYFTMQNGSYEAWVRDSLKEEGHLEAMPWLLARGENWYNIMFLVGAVAGTWLWSLGLIDLAYLTGMGVAAAAACLCGLYMRENRIVPQADDGSHYERPQWRQVLAHAKTEWRNRELWAMYLVNAAANALTYLVNLVLLIFIKSHFFDIARDGESNGVTSEEWTWWSVSIVLTLAAMTLVGSLVFSRWLKRHLLTDHSISDRALVWANAGFNAVLAVPVLIAAMVFRDANSNIGIEYLVLFLVLMSVHKLAASTFKVATATLQNRVIGGNNKGRATILSLGATVQNVLIIILLGVGVGREPATLKSWLWPALCLGIATVWMLVAVGRKGSSTPHHTSGVTAHTR